MEKKEWKGELARQLASAAKEGAGWSLKALAVLHKGGVEVGGLPSFMGMLITAYGIGRSAGLTPREFAEICQMLAEGTNAMAAGASEERRREVMDRAAAWTREMGIDMSPKELAEAEEQCRQLDLKMASEIPAPKDGKVH